MEVSEEVWADMHKRYISLELSSFLPTNYLAMEEGTFYDLKSHGGELAVKGRTGKFQQATSVYNAQRAIINMQSCYRQIWPENWTGELLFR